MPPLTYGDMKEMKKVFWRVRPSADLTALDLDAGDILVFEGSSPTGTITRYRKGAADRPNWATNCDFTALGQDASVDGVHFSKNSVHLDVSSRISTGGKATLIGTVNFPLQLGPVTWMADEGP